MAPARRHGIVLLRFVSCEVIGRSITPCLVTPWVEHVPGEASYTLLPQELFYDIVAYLSPTSSSLCTLTQVNRYHSQIHHGNYRRRHAPTGNAAISNAPPSRKEDSSISLFVRYARVSKAVHDKLEALHKC